MRLKDFLISVSIVTFFGECKNALLRNRRLSNGYIDYYNRFPFMVGMYHELLNSDLELFCSASLISKKYVLTASVCLVGVESATLIFGANDTSKKSEPQRVQMKVPREYFIFHDDYDYINYDIALIELPEEISFTGFINFARLPKRNWDNIVNMPYIIIMGWGRPGPEASSSDFLHYIYQPIMPYEHCNETYPEHFHNSSICIAGTLGYTPCPGDIGGPAIFREEDFNYTVIGVASTQKNCSGSYPTIYTRVTLFLDWIHEITGIEIIN